MRFSKPDDSLKIITRSNSTYILDYDELNSLIETLYTSDFFDDPQLFLNSPQENISKIQLVPLNFYAIINQGDTVSTSNQMKIGNYVKNFDTPVSKINNEFQKYIYDFPFDFKDGGYYPNIIPNDFTAFEPYSKLFVYIPHIGVKELNMNYIYNNNCKFQFVFDFLTGDMIVGLFTQAVGEDRWYMADSWIVNISIELPLGSTNTLERSRNLAIQGLKGAGTLADIAVGGIQAGAMSAVTGLPMMMQSPVGSITDIATNIYNASISKSVSKANIENWLATFTPKTPCFIYIRDNVVEPNNYAHFYGKPSMKSVSINDITEGTYFKVASCHLEIPNIKSSELEELENILKSGVIK